MKLLNPKNVKAAISQEKESLIQEKLLLEQTIEKKRKEFNASFETSDETESPVQHALRADISTLKDTMSSFERENESLLLELSFLKSCIEDNQKLISSLKKEKDSVVEEYNAKKREEDTLLEKLEQNIDQYQEKIEHLQIQEDTIKRRMAVVEDNERSFMTKQGDLFALIAEKEQEIVVEKANVEAQRQSYLVLAEELEKEKAAIGKEKAHIESRQQALRFAFDQARLKGII